MKFRSSCDYELVRLCEWLLGYPVDAPENWRFSTWNHSRRRLTSPPTWQQREVRRFSFDRGYHFDLQEVSSEDPRQQLLDLVVSNNRAPKLINSAYERGCVTGATYLFFKADETEFYRLYLYDESEVQEYEQDGLKGWAIQSQSPDGQYKRKAITDQAYLKFAPSRNAYSDWGEPVEEELHGYGEVPGVQIIHKTRDHSAKPQPEFDWLSLEMALEICSQTLGAAANFNYFGGPFIISSDPKQTLQELLDRRQVLSGKVGQEMQDTGLLSMPAMPVNHKDFLESLSHHFANYHGLSWVPAAPPGDTSSLTLRILYGQSVATAAAVGELYLGGFSELLQKISRAAVIDNVTGYTDAPVKWSYSSELFPPTPVDKQQLLQVVEQLVGLGVRTEEALREYYPDYSTDAIAELLIGV